MVSFVATWNGEEIVYLVVIGNISRPFAGKDSFSSAWAFAQEMSHEHQRRLTELEIQALVAKANLIENQSRITYGHLGLDLLDNQDAPYWLFDDDYAVVKSRTSLDEAVQFSTAPPMK